MSSGRLLLLLGIVLAGALIWNHVGAVEYDDDVPFNGRGAAAAALAWGMQHEVEEPTEAEEKKPDADEDDPAPANTSVETSSEGVTPPVSMAGPPEKEAVEPVVSNDVQSSPHADHEHTEIGPVSQGDFKALQEALKKQQEASDAERERITALEAELKKKQEPVLQHVDPPPAEEARPAMVVPPEANDSAPPPQVVDVPPAPEESEHPAKMPKMEKTAKVPDPPLMKKKRLFVVWTAENFQMPLNTWRCEPCRGVKIAENAGQLSDFDVYWKDVEQIAPPPELHSELGWPVIQWDSPKGEGKQHNGWPGIAAFLDMDRRSDDLPKAKPSEVWIPGAIVPQAGTPPLQWQMRPGRKARARESY